MLQVRCRAVEAVEGDMKNWNLAISSSMCCPVHVAFKMSRVVEVGTAKLQAALEFLVRLVLYMYIHL